MGTGFSSLSYVDARNNTGNINDARYNNNMQGYTNWIKYIQDNNSKGLADTHKYNLDLIIKTMGDSNRFYKVDNEVSERLLEDTLMSMSKDVDPDIGLKIHLNKGAIKERTLQTVALQNIIQQIKESYRRQNINFWVYVVFITLLLIACYLLHNILYLHTHKS